MHILPNYDWYPGMMIICSEMGQGITWNWGQYTLIKADVTWNWSRGTYQKYRQTLIFGIISADFNFGTKRRLIRNPVFLLIAIL